MFHVPAPNYTQAPNALFDDWLPKLSHVELKVLMVIMRKTFGWHKVRDRISLSQLEKFTGANRQAILKATKKLESYRLILKTKVGEKGSENTFYELVVIEDSNNSYQYDQHTPPSMMNIPTKETLTKEKKEESPIVPKRGPISRKSQKEEKIERCVGVFTNNTQHNDLETRCNALKIDLSCVYDRLSKWKIGKGISGGLNDYKTITNWVLKAESEEKSNNPVIKNKDLAKTVVSKKLSPDISLDDKGIEFQNGSFYLRIDFTESGFREKLFNRLRKMNLNVEGL